MIRVPPSLFFACLLIMSSIVFADVAHADRRKICVDATGKVVLKRRCREAKGFSPLSLDLVAGAAQGPQGPVGPKGPKGETGPQGIQGEMGLDAPLIERMVVEGTQAVLGAGQTGSFYAYCPQGTLVVGGGRANGSADPDVRMVESWKSPISEAWIVKMTNDGIFGEFVRAQAVCLSGIIKAP